MKGITIRRIRATINILQHLTYVCSDGTELLEEQMANLEQVIKNIELWWEE